MLYHKYSSVQKQVKEHHRDIIRQFPQSILLSSHHRHHSTYPHTEQPADHDCDASAHFSEVVMTKERRQEKKEYLYGETLNVAERKH